MSAAMTTPQCPPVTLRDPQPISLDVLLEKYAKYGERSVEEVQRRVARALASVEDEPQRHAAVFLEALQRGFIPAGRIMSSAGAGIEATLINCFVQPVGDSVSATVGGRPSIYQALAEAAETLRRGGGTGFDFSAIRPRGAKVKGTGSNASGPVSYMRVFDRSCETVESAGARRGAQMGCLRIDHPDVEAFIHAKDHGELKNFNLSVTATDAFMRTLENQGEWELVHAAEPGEEQKVQGARRRDDGLWVYRTVPAGELWRQIMHSAYDHAEPGVLFLDRANGDNNLFYCEIFEATNPCAEQWLPPYGCCCLGSIDLTRFVRNAFDPGATFDYQAFAELIPTAVRMLDDVLDLTYWPLPRQREEAAAKRRVGLGFTGLGDALILLGLAYDGDEGRAYAARIAAVMRDEAYRASVELAREKGPFPLFDAERYLASGFASRLPEDLKNAIRAHGIRNSHLLSIAPTGTISLAFADNASNGIEPAYAWCYTRRKRQPDGTTREFRVEDHAWRLYREQGGDTANLPPAFRAAHDIGAGDHVRMLEAVQPYVDSAISKTVNVAENYPFEDFQDLYLQAWRAGLKGLATYRPNTVVGQVLLTEPVQPAATASRPDFDDSDPNRRLRLETLPEPALASLRWRRRPRPAGGNPAWTYFVEHPLGSFAVFVGHIENAGCYPFEVWINGAEQPRGLGALAKSVSMDMRSNDHGWLRKKLQSLMKAHGDDGFTLTMPPAGTPVQVPSLVAGFARLLHYRCDELGAFAAVKETPVLDALMSPKEPKTGTDGTLSWTVDILNPATGDDFVMGLKELVLPNGQRRPYSVWLSGEYPRVLDGLCKSLSFDMRVLDPAWIGAKLRQLLDFPEPRGDFLAWVPKEKRKTSYPSTIAYLCRLMLHRYAMLGILDDQGFPVDEMGLMDYGLAAADRGEVRALLANRLASGRRCPECGCTAVIRKDGCDFCTACGWLGACG